MSKSQKSACLDDYFVHNFDSFFFGDFVNRSEVSIQFFVFGYQLFLKYFFEGPISTFWKLWTKLLRLWNKILKNAFL